MCGMYVCVCVCVVCVLCVCRCVGVSVCRCVCVCVRSTFLGSPSQGVGYVRVQSFAMDTRQEMERALGKLTSLSPNKHLNAVVLDLRCC
jgi:hypothetical protein